MIIKDTIQRMVDGLPDPIPDLLSADHAALVQSCVIDLKRLAQQNKWKFLMRFTNVNTINSGDRNMLDYLERIDDLDCMASTAKDLVSFRDKLVFG